MRRLLALLLAAILLFATAACGEDPAPGGQQSTESGDKIAGLSVGGEFGEKISVKVDKPVTTKEPVTEVISEGDGNPVEANKKAMLEIVLANGKDGKKLLSTADMGTPQQVAMQENQFFPVVIKALVGKKQGSRVAIAATVEDVWGEAGVPQLDLKTSDTVVFVIDVLSVEPEVVLDGPKGKKVDPPANAPVVEESDGKVTGIDFSSAPKKAPTELKVIPLVKGEGPEAQAGRLVAFNYYGAVWGAEKPFDSSFSRGEPTPFGVGVKGLIPAWDKVIPGLKRGSRVLIIAPPDQAYGDRAQQGIPANSTLTFVVDVLGVDN